MSGWEGRGREREKEEREGDCYLKTDWPNINGGKLVSLSPAML